MSNLHTNFRLEAWTLNWTITQEASGSFTAQTPQGESVAKPATLRLIIQIIVGKYEIKEVHGN